MLTTQICIDSLRSTVCPACDNSKRARQTLCPSCYRRLNPQQKRALYNPVGAGYEEAVFDALAALGVQEPRLPE